ncbi:RHS repeat-associated core domain-containing protein [Sphaerisporangium corydalis]|uniref:RHS repeat-associated core domain-containing protein n=1 Tax=Sphaerisporangium corydalis TaxID=1441875 RepID=A0ABV9EC95_9ACTN|nr:RHS repeat-associated core domain-containing protein [Sphaerisporangium corydalis]
MIDTPHQQMGSAAGLPHLVSAKETATASPAGPVSADPLPPKGALPLATRWAGTAAEVPVGIRQERARRAAEFLKRVAGKDRMVSAAIDAREQGLVRSGDSAILAADVPDLHWTSPVNNGVVTSLTPILAAYGTSSVPAPLNWVFYDFTVCPSVNGEPAPYEECAESPTLSTHDGSPIGTWQVPDGTLKWGQDAFWYVQVSDLDAEHTISLTQKLTVLVPQPRVNAELAGGSGGQEFNALTGNYTSSVTDASVSTVGPPLRVTRTYNSADARIGAFGAGWSSRLETRVTAEPANRTVLLTRPDGTQARFGAVGDGTYASPKGSYYSLATIAGGGWRLKDKTSNVYVFDAVGRLTRLTDARGHAQDYSYGTDGKLAQVMATGGRSLTFTWSGAHVATVSTDVIDGQRSTWTYSYVGDKLDKVCGPGSSTACTVYAYSDGSPYRSAVLNTGPMAYLRFGEPAGASSQSADSETTDYWGAYYNVFGMTGVPGGLSGSTDTAANFAGTNVDYVHLADNSINLLGGRLSVEAWFKTVGFGTILGTQDTGIDYNIYDSYVPVVYVGKDGKLRGAFRGGGTPITSSGVVNNGTWHHVVLASSGSSQTLYLDGGVVGTRTGSVDMSDQVYAEVGSGQTSSSWSSTTTGNAKFPFKGQIDEFAIYGQALNAGEVQAHYDARVAGPQLTSVTLPSGRVWAGNTYDAVNARLKTHTDHNGGVWQIGRVTSNSAENDEVAIKDPHGGTETTEFDIYTRQVSSVTDQLTHKTFYEYDTGGFVAAVTDRNGHKTGFTHDARGNQLSRRTCASAGVCQTSYSSYYLNPADPFDPRNDSITATRDARSSGATDNTYAHTWEYTAFGEVSKEKTPPTPDFPAGRSTTSVYTDGSESAVGGGSTPAGLIKSYKDYKNNEWTYRYTLAGDLAESTQPSGLLLKYGYDALGRVTTRTEVSSAAPSGVTTGIAYDRLDQIVSHTGAPVTNEVTGVTHRPEARYTYDLDGNKLTDSVVDLTGGDPTRTITYTYDTYGRAETVTDPQGGVVHYTWDHTGAKTRIVNESGATFDYAYTPRGEVASWTLKNWTGSPVSPQAPRDVVLESYEYDYGGRLASSTDAMGRKRTYIYYDDDLLSREIADDVLLNGSMSQTDAEVGAYTYDRAGNLIRSVSGGLVRGDYVYDAAGRLSSGTIDPTGRALKSAYTYDANENLSRVTRTGAGTTRTEVTDYAYNASDQLISQTVENGANDLVTTWTIDDRGRVTGVTDPRGNLVGADPAAFTTTLRYDNAARLVEAKAAQVQIEKAGSVTAGRPRNLFGYDSAGRLTHVMDGEGRTTVTAYDKAGRVTSETSPAYTPPGGGTSVTPTVSYAYDPVGRLTGITNARGYVTTGEYDALGNLVRVTDPAPAGQQGGQWVTEYDLLGEPLAAVDPTGSRDEATYDGLGRPIKLTQVERKPTAAAYTTKREYNNAGYLIKSTAPGDKITNYGVNGAGELTSVSDPLGHASTYDHDVAGRTVKVTDVLGNATTAGYDLAGRQIEAQDLNSAGSLRTFGYGWDPAGNQTSATTPEGYTTRRTYDATNLLTKLVEPVAASQTIETTYGYDAAGALTRTTDGRNNTVWTTYNSLGLTESTTEPATSAYPDPADRTWTGVYDAAGNAVTTLEPGGVRIDRQFDHLDRLVRQTGTGAGVSTPDRAYAYDLADRLTGIGDYTLEYNDRSLLTKVSKPSGQLAAYAYDARQNPLQRTDTTGTATFTWDDADRLATAADPVSGRAFTYGYDNADRLTSLTSSTPATSQAFTYDDMDRLATHTLKNGSGGQLAKITYGWNKDDQLTSKLTSGTAGAGANTYGYDQSGRLTSWVAPNGNTTSYTWDASGNRTQAGGQTYVYDERDRLISGAGSQYTYTARGTLATETKAGVTRNLSFDAFDRLISDGDATYAYDALGRLSSRVKGGTEQRFTYSGMENDISLLADGAGTVQGKYGRDPFGNVLSLQESGGPALGVMNDQHGDVVGTFSGTALIDSTAYDPFGQAIAQTGTRRSLGYQGEYTDPDTGKVNMSARWYQPGTGGFTSRDEWTLAPDPSIQLNRHTYANGSPLTRTDPSGHCAAAYSPMQKADFYCPAPPRPRETEQQRLKEEKREQQKYHGQRPAPNNPTADTLTKEKKQQKDHVKPKPDPKKPDPPSEDEDSTSTPTPKKAPKTSDPKTGKPSAPVKPPLPEKPPASAKPKHCKQFPDDPDCGDSPKNKCKHFKDHTDCELVDAPSRDDNGVKPDDEPVEYDVNDLPPPEWEPVGGFVSTITPQGGPRDSATPPVETDTTKTTDDVVQTIINNVAPDLPPLEVPDEDPGCGSNSFVSGTPVLMADGSHKRIEDIKVGDQVLAADPSTARVEARPVTTLIKGKGLKSLVRLTVDVDGASGTATDTLTATEGHPFWLPTQGEWVNAGRLAPGMWLKTSAGTYVQITAVKHLTAHRAVYNLTIKNLHTYYVLAGDQAILVHNTGEDDSYIYRGIPENHWFYADALRGKAVPRGGHSNPARHNGGNTNSIFTSWTTDLDGVARDAAEEMGYPGIVMRIRVGAVSRERIHESPDIYGESERLVSGVLDGAEISIGGGPWHLPGCK